MTRFRPCIDLHAGKVKQIVGGTLNSKTTDLQTNFVSTQSAAEYAKLYRSHDLTGGHIIMLGEKNESSAREALAAWPGQLQVGGGINAENAAEWIAAGASKVGKRGGGEGGEARQDKQTRGRLTCYVMLN